MSESHLAPHRYVVRVAATVLCLALVLANSSAMAKTTVPYVLYDSNGQVLGLTTSFTEESATVRQGSYFLKYNLRRPWHGVLPVSYGTTNCSGPAFMHVLPADGVSGLDKRYLGFANSQWYQLDLESPIGTVKERKASDGKLYFNPGIPGLSCTGERVFSGSGIFFDEMLAVPLREVEVEPKPSSLKYPLYVEEYDSDEEYEVFGGIAVEKAANGYWISVTTGAPNQRFTVVAKLAGKKQLRWNSRSGSDGFKRLTSKQSLEGASVRLLIDGDVVDEVVAQP